MRTLWLLTYVNIHIVNSDYISTSDQNIKISTFTHSLIVIVRFGESFFFCATLISVVQQQWLIYKNQINLMIEIFKWKLKSNLKFIDNLKNILEWTPTFIFCFFWPNYEQWKLLFYYLSGCICWSNLTYPSYILI